MSFPAYREEPDDRAYHLRRVREEQLRAELATDPGVRRIHLQMAEGHAALVQQPQEAGAAATTSL